LIEEEQENRMTRVNIAAILAGVSMASFVPVTLRAQLTPPQQGRVTRPLIADCRHDVASEVTADKARREQALAVARAINSTEGRIAERTRRYAPLRQLGILPRTPDGFELRFYSNTNTYVFSIKDKQDTCHYAIFSDEGGILYENTPQRPQIGQR
jgi:hypothetical protein